MPASKVGGTEGARSSASPRGGRRSPTLPRAADGSSSIDRSATASPSLLRSGEEVLAPPVHAFRRGGPPTGVPRQLVPGLLVGSPPAESSSCPKDSPRHREPKERASPPSVFPAVPSQRWRLLHPAGSEVHVPGSACCSPLAQAARMGVEGLQQPEVPHSKSLSPKSGRPQLFRRQIGALEPASSPSRLQAQADSAHLMLATGVAVGSSPRNADSLEAADEDLDFLDDADIGADDAMLKASSARAGPGHRGKVSRSSLRETAPTPQHWPTSSYSSQEPMIASRTSRRTRTVA